MQDILEVNNLTMDFGGLRALDSVNIRVAAQKTVAIIGPNGAGKTTFFNCITGLYPPTAGDLYVRSQKGNKYRINGLKPDKITQLGMARTFQNIRLFANMSAIENVMIGLHCRTKAGVIGAILRDKKTITEEQSVVQNAFDLLAQMDLTDRANELAKNLPYGEQRRLEIARALATQPQILLLDEPAAGMNPNETIELVSLIRKIQAQFQISVLIIEHDMKMVMQLSDYIFVLDYGRLIASGTPHDIKKNPQVIQAYLGEATDA
jgi:branched-chain amino acid transport system ATP-binding protein